MKRAGFLAFAAAAVLGVAASEALRAPCDIKTVEPASYCEKEGRTIFEGSVKDGKCPNDQSEVKKIEMCVKKHYVCGCAKAGCCDDDKLRPGTCKCGKTLEEKAEKAMVLYVCEGCGAKSPVKGGIAHDEAKDKAAPKKGEKRVCEKSGTFPHGK